MKITELYILALIINAERTLNKKYLLYIKPDSNNSIVYFILYLLKDTKTE